MQPMYIDAVLRCYHEPLVESSQSVSSVTFLEKDLTQFSRRSNKGVNWLVFNLLCNGILLYIEIKSLKLEVDLDLI